ncbi:MAG: cation-translocating P-type ATPase [Deltaproteobacteria bacterium]|jgi:Cd2+/Zn2+-exporting ATPase|nr:cation-translocating P-type ATPase [Deltaproteobacteria bacterium]
MFGYCPVCGHVHEGEAHHHHHQEVVLSGGESLATSERRESKAKGGLAAAGEEEDGDPASPSTAQDADDLKTAYFTGPGLKEALASGGLKSELTSLFGVKEVDYNLEGDLLAVTYSLVSPQPVEAFLSAKGFLATPFSPKPASLTIPMAKVGSAPMSKVKPTPNETLTSEANPAPLAVPKEATRFHLPGMCCALEANQLRAKLEKITGVSDLNFNLNDRTIAVVHGLPSNQPILDLFKAEGFEATLVGAASQPKAKPTPWGRYLVATALAFLAEGLHFQGFPFYLTVVLAIASFIFSGFEVYKEGLLSFKRLKLDMNALMSLAVTGAVVIGEVAEGAMVLALFSLAEALEDRSLQKARAAIASLLGLAPDVATVKSPDGQWRVIRAQEAPVGTMIQIRPGEKLPLDGRVVSGYTAINQAPVTGESAPVDKGPGDQVYAGTINGSGSIEYVTTAAFKDSTLAKVAAFVEASESRKAPVERIVDRFAAYYTPAVFALATLVALIPPLFLGGAFGEWLYKALVLLVISCPCALVISVPVTILCGLAAAAKKGLVIKGGAVLEIGRKIKIVALDKTGTITTGQPKLTGFQVLNGADPKQVELLAVSLAARSDHPVSRAIYENYPAKDDLLEVQFLEAYPGKGLGGIIEGRTYRLGSLKLLPEGEFESEAGAAAFRSLTQGGRSGVIFLEEDAPLAIFAVADSLKTESLTAIEEMRRLGLKTVMLTGDHVAVAETVAKEAGVSDWRGGLMPEDKATAIAELKKEGVVAMAGDGINDAPALVTADVGFAMAMIGADVAIETASVAIMDDKLSKIPAFVRLAKSVWTLIVENFIVVFTIKLSFMALTMMGFAHMWMAVIADIGVCMLVVGNGLRATRK